ESLFGTISSNNLTFSQKQKTKTQQNVCWFRHICSTLERRRETSQICWWVSVEGLDTNQRHL
ncbi:unnamed protein product, partial [Tetraodon nigroviridis]